MRCSKELFDEFRALGLPPGEYAIVSGGVLAIRGIRETNDIDAVVSKKMWNKLKNVNDVRIENGLSPTPHMKFNDYNEQ